MRKYINIYEEWKMVKPSLGFISSKNLGKHIDEPKNKSSNIYNEAVIVKLTDNSLNKILEIVKEHFEYEYNNWNKKNGYITLFYSNTSHNNKYLKNKELNFEIDGICKTEFGIYGRIKHFSFSGFLPNIKILENQDNIDSIEIIKNLNYKNINNIKLSGYIYNFINN